MDVLKRAWLYITRKKKKSLIMLFILFAIATAILSGIAVKKATNIAKENATSGLSNFFSINSQRISRKTIEEILKIKDIKNYNASIDGGGNIDGLKKVKPTKEAPYDYEGLEKTFIATGNDNTESDLKFVNKSIKLVEGRHIKPGDKGKVLVHKSLAKLNNLKIGDKLTINKMHGRDSHAVPGKGQDQMTLEIVGIFDNVIEEAEREGTYLDLIENYLLTDNNSIQEFYGYTDNDDVFYTTSFYADKNTNIDSVISKVKQLPINLNGARIDKSGDIFLALSKSFETMDKIVNMMLIGSAVIGVVILSLILTFWIQGRIHETGILLSIGVSKFKIIAQYISELLIISVLAFSLSYFSGQLIAQNVGDSLMQKAANETVQSIKQEAGFALGNDPDTKMLTYTSKDIEVKITPKEMVYVWAVGSAVITASVAISSLSIIRLKPKEILSKMS
ncbi:ABC transporter permease [Romboutsia sp. 1001285H_161024_C4]|uniref:ABC transporter permease n=1 Tax=Romboutsia sp. 1001285H_161024_C4 TaxID=2787109 RepID=UPI0018983153|nr:FtsX-like permease family protein [Romboutsia sp. 1001285H_161024_C4]